MKMQRCPLCHNHCPIDSLSCSKGKKHFASEAGKEQDKKHDKVQGKEQSKDRETDRQQPALTAICALSERNYRVETR